MRIHFALAAIVLCCLFALDSFAQSASETAAVGKPAGWSLAVMNEAGKKTEIRSSDLASLKRLTVKASDHGKEAVFEGVALADVLKLAGVEFGESLRGKRLASYLLVEAADGYRAIFALPELDPAFTDKVVLLADKRDGQPLAKNAGDLQIVVPDEKRAARWVRQIVSLKIVQVN